MLKRLLKRYGTGREAVVTLTLDVFALAACAYESGLAGWTWQAGKVITHPADPFSGAVLASVGATVAGLSEGALYLLATILLCVWVRSLVGLAFKRWGLA